MRLFFHIAYDGSKYSGWQWQPNADTIQEVIEQKLAKIFKEKITVFGCGRTDKGVHASQYFFHIELNNEPNFDIQFILNKHLPSTIYLFEVIKVEERQHSRYDAISRSYDYFLHTKPDPFLDKYSTLFNLEQLDFKLMQEAASIVASYNEFRSFCLRPDAHNHTQCKISESNLYLDEVNGRLRFSITGDRFLKGMIRLLVAGLLKVGRKQITINEFRDYLENPRDIQDLKKAAPNGLYLSSVVYPYLKRGNQSQLFQLLKQDLR